MENLETLLDELISINNLKNEEQNMKTSYSLELNVNNSLNQFSKIMSVANDISKRFNAETKVELCVGQDDFCAPTAMFLVTSNSQAYIEYLTDMLKMVNAFLED